MSNVIKKLPIQFNGKSVGSVIILDDGTVRPLFDESEEAIECMFFLIHLGLRHVMAVSQESTIDIKLSMN